MLRELIVRKVKPVLSEQAWQQLRSLDPTSAARDRKRAKRATLTELAQQFGTDKWGPHRYTPHYQRFLEGWRDKEFALLEIGIGGYAREKDGGKSLRMWKAFFPKAQIIGLDIEDKSFVDEDRIITYMGSQVDPEMLDKIMAEHDIRVIVDDGSHQNEHVIASFKHLFPLLPNGGTYCIEDTQTSYWSGFGGSTDPAAPTMMNMVKDLLDGLNWEEHTLTNAKPTVTQKWVKSVHAFHNLVIIEKGRNTEADGKRLWSAERAAEAKAARHKAALSQG